jgi:hypothetical protein
MCGNVLDYRATEFRCWKHKKVKGCCFNDKKCWADHGGDGSVETGQDDRSAGQGQKYSSDSLRGRAAPSKAMQTNS